MTASIETTSRYRSSRRCSKRVIVPSGGTGGGFSHFKLKRIGRPLIVKDTVTQGARLGVVTQIGAGGALMGPRRLLAGAAAGRLRRCVGLRWQPIVGCG